MVKAILTFVALVSLLGNLLVNPAFAKDLDEATRTVKFDENSTIVLTPKELQNGKKLFNSACASCHSGGATFTNPNVGLDMESLKLATPPRDNLLAMIDYLKNPTSYDGEEEIYELHPSLRSTDVFPQMRGLTEQNLKEISGYVLYSAQLKGVSWGGGKVYY
ncbi:MAG: photosystem II cytochrome c-550 [Pseudanabaenaceae cyanobacterium SKYGB_i_bin29]|nr:photosystem II cytochrome c-550 [Pseudanabaenaceae cyanobacterium SKYG29]MDW8420949.1 photosystem II cytochrome c-550 [Pseudanabaenaceae cyanobacterium SKYGB_i_bin29]